MASNTPTDAPQDTVGQPLIVSMMGGGQQPVVLVLSQMGQQNQPAVVQIPHAQQYQAGAPIFLSFVASPAPPAGGQMGGPMPPPGGQMYCAPVGGQMYGAPVGAQMYGAPMGGQIYRNVGQVAPTGAPPPPRSVAPQPPKGKQAQKVSRPTGGKNMPGPAAAPKAGAKAVAVRPSAPR